VRKKATKLILDTIDEFEAKGYANIYNSYISNMLKALKSWLKLFK
jgi:hypothetical protein